MFQIRRASSFCLAAVAIAVALLGVTALGTWRTVEFGGLAFSLPIKWKISPEMLGMRVGYVNWDGGGPRADIDIVAWTGAVDWAEMNEEIYRQSIGDGYVYADARVERFTTDPIGEWKAIRAVLTARRVTPWKTAERDARYFLNSATVEIGSELIRITCSCDARFRDSFEETFERIIASIRAPG